MAQISAKTGKHVGLDRPKSGGGSWILEIVMVLMLLFVVAVVLRGKSSARRRRQYGMGARNGRSFERVY